MRTYESLLFDFVFDLHGLGNEPPLYAMGKAEAGALKVTKFLAGGQTFLSASILQTI